MDYATAHRLLRPLAESGDAVAQENKAVMFLEGRGVPQDYAEALKWFLKAAERGQGSAQGWLGYMYRRGRCVPQDYVQAHMWFNLAATHEEVAAAAEERDEPASQMTPAQIAEAQKLAREWKPKLD